MKICGTVLPPFARSIISARSSPVAGHVDLRERHALARQQFLCRDAIGAIRRRVNLDLDHVARCSGASIRRCHYMGAAPPSTTRANTSTSTCAAPAAQQRPRAGIDGRAGGEHVVDQDQPASRDLGLAVRRHAEGALHVAGALGLRQPDLLGVALTRLSAHVGDRHAAASRDRLRQQRPTG